MPSPKQQELIDINSSKVVMAGITILIPSVAEIDICKMIKNSLYFTMVMILRLSFWKLASTKLVSKTFSTKLQSGHCMPILSGVHEQILLFSISR